MGLDVYLGDRLGDGFLWVTVRVAVVEVTGEGERVGDGVLTGVDLTDELTTDT